MFNKIISTRRPEPPLGPLPLQRRTSRTEEGLLAHHLSDSMRAIDDSGSPVFTSARVLPTTSPADLEKDLPLLAQALNPAKGPQYFNRAELEKLLECAEIVELSEPGVLYRRSRAGNSCYCLLEGAVDVFVKNYQVATRKPGELVGTSLFSRTSRSSTVIATTRTRAAKFDIDKMRSKYPTLYEKFTDKVNTIHEQRKAQKDMVLATRNPYAGTVISLIANDGMKDQVIDLVAPYLDTLQHFVILATDGTARILQEAFPGDPRLLIVKLSHGPHGGDFELLLAKHTLRLVVFLPDTLNDLAHSDMIEATRRLLTSYNIPVADNTATAKKLMASLASKCKPPRPESMGIEMVLRRTAPDPRAAATECRTPSPQPPRSPFETDVSSVKLASTPPAPPRSLGPSPLGPHRMDASTFSELSFKEIPPTRPTVSCFLDLLKPSVQIGNYLMLVANNNTEAKSLLLSFVSRNRHHLTSYCHMNNLIVGTTSELYHELRDIINDPSDSETLPMKAFGATALGGIEEMSAMLVQGMVTRIIYAKELNEAKLPRAEHLSFSTLQSITKTNFGLVEFLDPSEKPTFSLSVSLASGWEADAVAATEPTSPAPGMGPSSFVGSPIPILQILTPPTIKEELTPLADKLAHLAALARDPETFLRAIDGTESLELLLTLSRCLPEA
jgi:methylglyoxal synthase